MTVATAALSPEPIPGPGLGATAADEPTETITWDDFKAWERQLTTTGSCSHPIRLTGRIEAIDRTTGEIAPVYDTSHEPGGVLHVACGNRRESVCLACSQVYKRDARQLVRAGLMGGKGVPETVAAHPCVFATFTAPSFGPVHSRRMRGKAVLPCRPRRDAHARRCPHGHDISCPTRHVEDDPRLGQALCPDCYDYQAAVLFNAHAGKLWRRFTTYLPRHLARLAGVTGKIFRAQVRIRYVKVAQYQARGVVHFHAVIRLDASSEGYLPPPARYTPGLLCDAIGQAVAAVRVPAYIGALRPVLLRFGTQTDRRPVQRDTIVSAGRPLNAAAVANYIAKYVTKSLDVPGLPDTRLRSAFDIRALRCPAHYQRMMTAAWELGARKAPKQPLYRKWAHMLGYGGQPLTKSRRYSVTFGHLRGQRVQHRRAQRHPNGERDPWDRPLDEAVVLVVASWTYAGTGYTHGPGAELATASAAWAREHRGQADTAA